MNNWPDHFRYIDSISPTGVTITCERYVVVRESEHCYWIAHENNRGWVRMQIEKGVIPKLARRVLKSSWCRFAYPDKAEALRSYEARKRWQIRHAQLSLERARAALDEVADRQGISDKHLCAGGEYIRGMNWSEY